MENPSESSLDWRLILAMTLTVFWLSSGVFYLGQYIGWTQFFNQPLESLGSFLEGAFAPLAFLWLVVGYFLQQKELAKNTEVIHKQFMEMQKNSQHAAQQAKSIEASALHTQQQAFLRIFESVRDSLGGIVGMLYISSQGSTGAGLIDADDMAQLWTEKAHGDPEVFARKFLFIRASGEQNMEDLICGSDVRSRHSANFVRQYERMIKAAKECDPDGMITEAITSSAHGLLYEIMTECKSGSASD